MIISDGVVQIRVPLGFDCVAVEVRIPPGHPESFCGLDAVSTLHHLKSVT
jgi:hypothetical protein